MLLSCEVERETRQLCREAFSFKRLWHFGMVKNDSVWKTAISQQSVKSVGTQLEAMCLFVVDDIQIVKIHVQGSLCSITRERLNRGALC